MYSDIPFWLSLVLMLCGLAVLGNIIGSNLFNTLAVVGLATVISPLVPGPNGEPAFSRYILTRDIPLMTALSLSNLKIV